jgi:hypothetical protein
MVFDPYGYDLARSAQQRAQAAQTVPPLPPEAHAIFWRGLRVAVEEALDLWERTPAGARREPPPLVIQHAGQPLFHPDFLRQQTRKGWHRLMGIELQLTAQVLEALILTQHTETYQRLLAEQCARVSQLYGEMARRVGAGLACALLLGELRRLRYRASRLLAPLAYN